MKTHSPYQVTSSISVYFALTRRMQLLHKCHKKRKGRSQTPESISCCTRRKRILHVLQGLGATERPSWYCGLVTKAKQLRRPNRPVAMTQLIDTLDHCVHICLTVHTDGQTDMANRLSLSTLSRHDQEYICLKWDWIQSTRLLSLLRNINIRG